MFASVRGRLNVVVVAVFSLVVGLSVGVPAVADAAVAPSAVPGLTAASGAGASFKVAAVAKKKRRVLRVRVVQPLKGRGKVTVTGPKGYRKVLRRTKSLKRLQPGRYRIRAKTVSRSGWVATPTYSRRKVRIRKKTRLVKRTVSYWNVVSKKTDPIPTSRVKKFRAPPASGTGVVKSTTVQRRGDILAASVSSKTPDGMLVKVVKVKKASGNVRTYKVRQATLQEAIPRGEFSETVNVDLAPPSGTSTSIAATDADQAGRVSVQSLGASCSGSAKLSVDVTPSGGIKFTSGGSWDYSKSSLWVRADAQASAEFRAWVEGNGSCGLDKRLWQQTLPAIRFSIGPVPVVIVPSFEMRAGAKAGVSSKAAATATVKVSTTIQASANKDTFTASYSKPRLAKSASFKVGAGADAEVYAKAILDAKLYGLAGPYVSLKLGPHAQANVNQNPWWKVDSLLQGGVGIRMDKCVWRACIKFDKSNNNLINERWRIKDSGGPRPTQPVPGPPPPTPDFPAADPGPGLTTISTGPWHTCALDTGGQAWCWGEDRNGALGDGDDDQGNEYSPVRVAGARTFTTISAGDFHTCALDTGGQAWCWGRDRGWNSMKGQLGGGDDDQGNEYSPVRVAGARTFTTISAGGSHTCALDTGGQAWCWGGDEFAQLGDGDDDQGNEYSPVRVAGARTFTTISAGGSHTCALDTGGQAWCWGDDFDGQVGNGLNDGRKKYVPTPVVGGVVFNQISVSRNTTCGLDTRGEAWCWGATNFGAVGHGEPPEHPNIRCLVHDECANAPMPVAGGARTFTTISAASCALDTGGQAWCWGHDGEGRLGDGDDDQGNEYSPVRVAGARTFTTIATGSHTCALDTGGQAWCWGHDGEGQLGDGDDDQGNEYSPVRVAGGHTFLTP